MFKQNSIKKNLITSLFISLAVTLTAIYFISFFNTKNSIRATFDANLVKSSKLIFGLIKHEIVDKKDLEFLADFNSAMHQKIFHKYEYVLHSQAWKGNNLIYSSDDSFQSSKPNYEGFQDVVISNANWRSFAFYDEKSDIKILVLEQYQLRDRLIFKILLSLTIPLLLSFVPLFFIIITIVNKKLNPLNDMTNKIAKMSEKTLDKISQNSAPLELQPFILSFNNLIGKLAQSMEAERRFTDYAAHELKTPLAAIKIQAQLLAKNHDEKKSQEYLQDLLQGVERANHMVAQLLTLARIESNQITKEKFNYTNLIEFVIKNYSTKAQEKNISIDFYSNINSDEALILANKTYIEIMLNNLIENAIKYSFENSVIKFLLDKNDDKILLKIINQGEELSQNEIDNLFKNFYRGNKASSLDSVGSGLGLAIVKKIADLHLAKISFASKNQENIVTVIFL